MVAPQRLDTQVFTEEKGGTMEYLNWFAEHPWLGLLILMTISSAAWGLGGKGKL